MQKFITANEKPENRKQIVPRMPNSTVSLQDIALIEDILFFKIGDLWTRVYDIGILVESLP